MEDWADLDLPLPLPLTPPPRCQREALLAPPKVEEWKEGKEGLCNDQHKELCAGCPRCVWIKNKDKWQKACGTWLTDKLDLVNKHWGLGCALCAAVREDPEIAKLGLHKNMKAFGAFQVTNSSFTKIKL